MTKEKTPHLTAITINLILSCQNLKNEISLESIYLLWWNKAKYLFCTKCRTCSCNLFTLSFCVSTTVILLP